MGPMVTAAPAGPAPASDVRAFLRRAAAFALVGAGLYAGLYVWAERLVFRHAERNRFFMVRSAPPGRYDYLLLGASHAAVFGYRDLNARLGRMAGARIMNLSVVGGGIAVNRLLLDYFLTRHQTRAVVYVVDSFAFYSPQWNEDRLADARLFVRAPFDPALAARLWRSPAPWTVALDYVTGFSKINNASRYAPDVPAEEGARFERAYRPVRQVDRQRLEYLYPDAIDETVFARYLAEFDRFVGDVKRRGIELIVLKPPLPSRVLDALPGEDRFDERLVAVLDRHGVPLYDFSRQGNDDPFFYDTDHLNLTGVLNFYEHYLGPLLRSHGVGGRDR
jgi:hypothetical protein